MDEHCGKFSCEDKDGMQRAKELWDEEHEERQAESSIAPTGLDVVNLNDVYAEQYRLNGSYMLVLEDYDFQRGDAMISMFAPGFSQYFTERLESTYMTTRSMHQHAFFEFMYVMKGKAVQKIEGEEYACEAGQCCLLNHYVRHVETPVENTELFFLCVSDCFFSQIIQSDVRFNEKGCIVSNKNPIYEMVESVQKKAVYQKQYWEFVPVVPADIVVSIFENLFGRLIIESNERIPGFLLMVQSLVARIISYLLNPDYFSYQKVILPSDQEEYLFLRVQDALVDSHGRISRAKLATELNYSPDYLNKIVKKRTGMFLSVYGRKFTLKEAARLLSQTSMSISKIMSELGFQNRSHFYHIFKEKYGVTPNEYRETAASRTSQL